MEEDGGGQDEGEASTVVATGMGRLEARVGGARQQRRQQARTAEARAAAQGGAQGEAVMTVAARVVATVAGVRVAKRRSRKDPKLRMRASRVYIHLDVAVGRELGLVVLRRQRHGQECIRRSEGREGGRGRHQPEGAVRLVRGRGRLVGQTP